MKNKTPYRGKCHNCKKYRDKGAIIETNGALGEDKIFLCNYCIGAVMNAVPMLRRKKMTKVD